MLIGFFKRLVCTVGRVGKVLGSCWGRAGEGLGKSWGGVEEELGRAWL